MKDGNKKPVVLVIDDEPDFAFLLSEWLKAKGLFVLTAESAKDARPHLEAHAPDLIIVDVMLEESSGIDLVRQLKSQHHDVPVIMVSAFGDTQYVIAAMKAGASDYVQKPLDYQELWTKISTLLNMRSSEITRMSLLGSGKSGDAGSFIGDGPRVKQLINEVSRVAHSDATVLLRGESGVGKSHIAKLIHDHSPRKNQTLVTINCAAIPENLLESELFGHEKGSFTGAVRDKIGKFELADKGSIFLDEIGELSPELQVKLLRVLQNREFERVGGLKTLHVDVRIIAATNRNLEKSVQENRFREDLFYRLNVLPVYVPPLRERREDIHGLIRHFLKLYSDKSKKRFGPVSDNILNHLVEYDWPGNIRELQNVVERAVVLGIEPQLKFSDFTLPVGNLKSLSTSETITNPLPPPPASIFTPSSLASPESSHSVRDIRAQKLLDALRETGGNVIETAKILGISRAAVYRRLKKYNIAL